MRVLEAQRVKVSAGAKLHHDAREMRSFELRVESRKERVVQHLQDFSLHFRSLRLLFQCHCVFVHHLHRVQTALFILLVFYGAVELPVSEAAEVDGADVAGADATEEVEVAEGESGLAAEGGGANGGVGEVGGAMRLKGETLRRGREEIEGKTAETSAANALAAHGASKHGRIESLGTGLGMTFTTTRVWHGSGLNRKKEKRRLEIEMGTVE